jgi:hypothetical protein
MKMFAKFCFTVLLLMGVSITIVSTIWSNNPFLTEATLNVIVVALSMVGTFLAAVLSAVNPVAKWQQLKSTALAIESEVWKYRARSGPYSLGHLSAANATSASRRGEERLRDFLTQIEHDVARSATVMDTRLLSRFDTHEEQPRQGKVYRHGQHSGAGIRGTFEASNLKRDQRKAESPRSRVMPADPVEGTEGQLSDNFDDHHSPIRPDDYLRFRVRPMLRFYRRRMPKYEKYNLVLKILIILASLASTVLGVAGYAKWAPITAAFAALFTAYSQFLDPGKKLERYSTTSLELRDTVLWWHSLSDVDQASTAQVSRLVDRVEKLIAGERTSWMGTNSAGKATAAAASKAKGASDGGGGNGSKNDGERRDGGEGSGSRDGEAREGGGD